MLEIKKILLLILIIFNLKNIYSQDLEINKKKIIKYNSRYTIIEIYTGAFSFPYLYFLHENGHNKKFDQEFFGNVYLINLPENDEIISFKIYRKEFCRGELNTDSLFCFLDVYKNMWTINTYWIYANFFGEYTFDSLHKINLFDPINKCPIVNYKLNIKNIKNGKIIKWKNNLRNIYYLDLKDFDEFNFDLSTDYELIIEFENQCDMPLKYYNIPLDLRRIKSKTDSIPKIEKKIYLKNKLK